MKETDKRLRRNILYCWTLYQAIARTRVCQAQLRADFSLMQSRFNVVATVRNGDKGTKLLDALPAGPASKLSYVVVEDVAKNGAFDEVSLCQLSHRYGRC